MHRKIVFLKRTRTRSRGGRAAVQLMKNFRKIGKIRKIRKFRKIWENLKNIENLGNSRKSRKSRKFDPPLGPPPRNPPNFRKSDEILLIKDYFSEIFTKIRYFCVTCPDFLPPRRARKRHFFRNFGDFPGGVRISGISGIFGNFGDFRDFSIFSQFW